MLLQTSPHFLHTFCTIIWLAKIDWCMYNLASCFMHNLLLHFVSWSLFLPLTTDNIQSTQMYSWYILLTPSVPASGSLLQVIQLPTCWHVLASFPSFSLLASKWRKAWWESGNEASIVTQWRVRVPQPQHKRYNCVNLSEPHTIIVESNRIGASYMETHRHAYNVCSASCLWNSISHFTVVFCNHGDTSHGV